ncbi:MAG: hypothetical protein ACFFD4_04500 [Candidatus Odinarchaeota archaeon]
MQNFNSSLSSARTRKNPQDLKKEQKVLKKRKKELKKARKHLKELEEQLNERELQLYHPQPIDLTMKHDQVIIRLGNAAVITRILKEKPVLLLTFPKCTIDGKYRPLTIYFRASDSVQQALEQGAVVKMLNENEKGQNEHQ